MAPCAAWRPCDARSASVEVAQTLPDQIGQQAEEGGPLFTEHVGQRLAGWLLRQPPTERDASRVLPGCAAQGTWSNAAFTFDFIHVSADLAPRVRSLQVDAGSAALDHQPVLLDIDFG